LSVIFTQRFLSSFSSAISSSLTASIAIFGKSISQILMTLNSLTSFLIEIESNDTKHSLSNELFGQIWRN
jgi:hypothetical protein